MDLGAVEDEQARIRSDDEEEPLRSQQLVPEMLKVLPERAGHLRHQRLMRPDGYFVRERTDPLGTFADLGHAREGKY